MMASECWFGRDEADATCKNRPKMRRFSLKTKPVFTSILSVQNLTRPSLVFNFLKRSGSQS